jgi:hypothetical protein
VFKLLPKVFLDSRVKDLPPSWKWLSPAVALLQQWPALAAWCRCLLESRRLKKGLHKFKNILNIVLTEAKTARLGGVSDVDDVHAFAQTLCGILNHIPTFGSLQVASSDGSGRGSCWIPIPACTAAAT